MTAFIIVYLLFCAADIILTFKGLDLVGFKEANPLMALLMIMPWAFWAVEVALNGIAVFLMLKLGIGLAIIAVIVKGAVVANNAMLYQKAIKRT